MQKITLTQEDVDHIHSAYRERIGHLAWLLRHVITGAIAGTALAAVFGSVEAANPALWLGAVYGTSLPSASLKGAGAAPALAAVLAPVTFAQECARRFRVIAAGRRALHERFKDREPA